MSKIFLIRKSLDTYRSEKIILRNEGGIYTNTNISIFYVSTTFILTDNNWTTCFDCYSVIFRSKVVSYRELCAHWDPKLFCPSKLLYFRGVDLRMLVSVFDFRNLPRQWHCRQLLATV